ncbi:uncharacterized protein YecT (DUF1311 family) [Comamonas odontotermitis]|uniref:Uncharacterized protein YecT (DUF1311 family) n=1 Tax=Comamonas odontotermitis TaxID=379895 RepID=A0ABR6RK85_9BURK|nr:lysozyme inhibitor LprI family protein [Comamonas odontotermitis]MBB6579576.1 uncharacterized protein YecT (DUF1311 family) [Comamonas odontotermitis]
MKAKNLLAIAVLIAAVSGVSHAKDDQFADIDCSKDQDSTLGMKVCAAKELDKTKQALKAKRAEMLKKVGKEQRKAANSYIKASDAYATALCSFEDEAYHGGTIQSLVHGMCLDGEYQRQIKVIDEYMNRPEGSL